MHYVIARAQIAEKELKRGGPGAGFENGKRGRVRPVTS